MLSSCHLPFTVLLFYVRGKYCVIKQTHLFWTLPTQATITVCPSFFPSFLPCVLASFFSTITSPWKPQLVDHVTQCVWIKSCDWVLNKELKKKNSFGELTTFYSLQRTQVQFAYQMFMLSVSVRVSVLSESCEEFHSSDQHFQINSTQSWLWTPQDH